VAVATLLVLPGDETTAAGVRALAESFCGEVAASAWKGMMVVRFCAADGGALRHDLVAVLRTIRGRSLPRLWLN
jgi:urease accessory protein